MYAYTLTLGDSRANLETVGGKGAALAEMVAADLPVPTGFHVTTEAYRAFVAAHGLGTVIDAALADVDPGVLSTLEAAERAIRARFEAETMPPDIAAAVAQAYARLEGIAPVVAVRSSATAEDLPDLSFAGQQDTYLNISGVDNVLAAVKRCWASLWTARAIGYRVRHAVAPDRLALAVVVQRLVPAEVAGILFTANPLNGRRDQVVLNAAWGLGEAIVSGLVTPDTFVVDKVSGQESSSEIADKVSMTVRVDGGTETQPVTDDLRRARSLSDGQVAALVKLGNRIEALYGSPRDVEFAIADGEIAVVQARPITALPPVPLATEPAPAIEWVLPKPEGKYMRSSIIDLMPDPLMPVFATLGVDTINETMHVLLDEMFGAPVGTLPGDTVVTINGYAYMGVNYTFKQTLLLLWYTMPNYGKLMRTGIQYWQEGAYPKYKATTAEWESRDPVTLAPGELVTGIHEMSRIAMYHLAALMGSTMGPAAGVEQLFTTVYEKLIRKEGDPPATDFLLGFDNLPLTAEKALHDLAVWARERQDLTAYLRATQATEVVAAVRGGEVGTPDGVDTDTWSAWCDGLGGYLRHYGYAIYYLDFARELPLDNPAPIVEMLKLFLDSRAQSPYDRQAEFVARREAAQARIRGRIRGLKRWAFEKTLAGAHRRVPLRETGIAEIGIGFPVLRTMLRELGRRFAAAGTIAEIDDIFWLKWSEIEAGVESLSTGSPLVGRHQGVAARRATWQSQKRLTPPPALPPKTKYMGINMAGLSAKDDNVAGSSVVKGAGTSPGRATGPACVLLGPEDFDKMKMGSILVAPATTPAWTPLFAMAAGVVTDIGGPLSHGSIVAREYGIPAVMGTGSGTKIIEDGRTITVVGETGEVLLA